MNQQKLKFHFILVIFGSFLTLNASTQAVGFEEYGSASYYSDTFHGKKTASGELYDKDGMTCAHSTLPNNTMVKVTRMDNNKSVVVRVNDRMPLIKGKVIDLSRKAAGVIDLISDGRAKVKIEVLDVKNTATATGREEPKAASVESRSSNTTSANTEIAPSKPTTPPTEVKIKETTVIKEAKTAKKETAPTKTVTETNEPGPPLVTGKSFTKNGSYQVELREVSKKSVLVQVISLSSIDAAMLEVAKLQGIFPGKVVLTTDHAGELNATFKVSIGAFLTRAEAEKAQTKASKKGYPKSFIVNLAD